MKKYLRNHMSKGWTLARADADFPGNDLSAPLLTRVSLETSELPLDWVNFEMVWRPLAYIIEWYKKN